MNQDEIKDKAAKLAAFYTSLAAGKKLQFHYGETFPIWVDCKPMDTPRLSSDLSYYRVKPEPLRIWVSGTAWTDSPVIAAALREVGQEAREFVEVLS